MGSSLPLALFSFTMSKKTDLTPYLERILKGDELEQGAHLFSNPLDFWNLCYLCFSALPAAEISADERTSIAIYRQFFEKSGRILKQTNYGDQR
jgi:hypothetical protein